MNKNKTSVTKQNSCGVSNASNSMIIFSCYNLRKISISYLKLVKSFSDFPLIIIKYVFCHNKPFTNKL